MNQAIAPERQTEGEEDERRKKIIIPAARWHLRSGEPMERVKWAARAKDLGFPSAAICSPDEIMKSEWVEFVAPEMYEKGLFRIDWEKELAKKPEPEPEKKTAQIIQLPLWAEPVRAVPNDILRSAIFAAIQGKTRRFLNKEIIASVDGVTIRFKGQQLNQSDADVWEQAMHLARCHPLGHICQFRGSAFLKSIGRSNGKAQYGWLDDSIDRLIACLVEIRSGSRVFTGSLLSSCIRDEMTGVYELTLDPKTIRLFSKDTWSTVVWEQRQALMGKPLALWLHGFYSSHAAPFALKVETLRTLSGSNDKILRNFRRALQRALDDLKACGAIADWKIDPITDLVSVDRGAAITDSQRRHLVKNPPKRERKPKNKPET